jgi:hypothetical protein
VIDSNILGSGKNNGHTPFFAARFWYELIIDKMFGRAVTNIGSTTLFLITFSDPENNNRK